MEYISLIEYINASTQYMNKKIEIQDFAIRKWHYRQEAFKEIQEFIPKEQNEIIRLGMNKKNDRIKLITEKIEESKIYIQMKNKLINRINQTKRKTNQIQEEIKKLNEEYNKIQGEIQNYDQEKNQYTKLIQKINQKINIVRNINQEYKAQLNYAIQSGVYLFIQVLFPLFRFYSLYLGILALIQVYLHSFRYTCIHLGNEYINSLLIPQELVAEYQHNINPDQMSYEQLLQLEQKIGSVSKGLSESDIQRLKQWTITLNRSKQLISQQNNENKIQCQQCRICCSQFTNDDIIICLQCRHIYHYQCIRQWLRKQKVCPLCKQQLIIK